MKDFADISNSVGSWPSVTAQDCSGPGETDGTAVIADTLTDLFGFIQALMNDAGETPDDSAETYTASQILNAIKQVIFKKEIIPLSSFLSTYVTGTQLPNWVYPDSGGNRFQSENDSSEIRIPVNLPIGLTLDVDITLKINPGAARTGGDRMKAKLSYAEYDDTTPVDVTSLVYDDESGDTQDLVVSTTSLIVLNNRDYFVRLYAGNDGSTNNDYVYGAKLEIALS